MFLVTELSYEGEISRNVVSVDSFTDAHAIVRDTRERENETMHARVINGGETIAIYNTGRGWDVRDDFATHQNQ